MYINAFPYVFFPEGFMFAPVPFLSILFGIFPQVFFFYTYSIQSKNLIHERNVLFMTILKALN